MPDPEYGARVPAGIRRTIRVGVIQVGRPVRMKRLRAVAAMTNIPPFRPRGGAVRLGQAAAAGCSEPQYLHLEAAAGRSLDKQ
jgi:hypothetical protein